MQVHGPMITDSCTSGSPSVDKDRTSEGHGRIPEMRADHGGAGLCGRGFSAAASPFPNSRTEHILSRYRPIAPKPTGKTGESAGSAPSDPQSSSTLSFERTSAKASSISSDSSRGGKRTRKRAQQDGSAFPRVAKKSSVPNGRPDKARTVSCKSIPVAGGIEKAVEQFSPDNGGHARPGAAICGVYPILKEPPGLPFMEAIPSDPQALFAVPSHCRFDRDKYGSSFGAIGRKNPRAQAMVESRVGPPRVDVVPKAELSAERCVPSAPPAERESAFMERAAASAPSGRRMNGFLKSGGYPVDYAHQVRGGCTPFNRGYANDAAASMGNGQGCSQYHDGGGYYPSQLPCISNSYGESEVTSGEGAESRKTDLVTLSLLPDTPYLEQTSSEVSMPKSNLPFLRLAINIESGNWDTDAQNEGRDELHKLTLFRSGGGAEEEEAKQMSSVEEERECSRGRGSHAPEVHSHPAEGRPLLETLERGPSTSSSTQRDMEEKLDVARECNDAQSLEQVYAGSSDPVMLSDAEGRYLWANQAFRRLSAERSREVAGPYIDPLGIRTELSSMMFQVPQGPPVRAVLWGFLKKFITRGGAHLAEENDTEYRNGMSERICHPSMREEAGDGVPANHHTVIAPQPIRPVGSTLTVLNITRISAAAIPLVENLEYVKEQLESISMPAIITDYRDRVRYMNAAYKQMVGQPECPWLSTLKKTPRENAQQNRLTGEVVLSCKENLGQLSAAFSCRVLGEWNCKGEREPVRMNLPTEVNRLEHDRAGPMYVWKLDVANGSRLPSGVLRQDCSQGTKMILD
ncbi:hypothetical protein MPTK1_2g17570 [Marchantia polymorpha subsp. ruderalis]|uniref:PAS domain-containing protein n=2 Tax=Marchantia polymorpha TaxID=3197 RepID=A0A176W0H0_MARPO|nr:hypothetical protein AXG93_3817s1120 [Marchantia polymorpha subsp. ruderalis]PTQ32848.1 hypothetical protein MARPO_0094s0025 [Marchantia polymorpha]BBN02724.1 hypothetical protein Mp_2g17570 [Marchantia polymorpha subsp. ruderalis]|eukprot:PTQ32848.1 hypothetical protein MARPO_0094s0025 [Marchantia polymorpha]